MATPQEVQKSAELEKLKKNLHRRSLDQLKVFNFLKVPFKTVFDGFTHTIDSGQERAFPRYIAEKLMRELVDYKINEDSQQAIDKENKKRLSKGWQPLNKHEEELSFVSSKGLLTNSPELRTKYLKMAYRGISEEHGLDIPEVEAKPRDVRPLDERLLEELDEELGVTLDDSSDVEEDLTAKKDNLIKEIE